MGFIFFTKNRDTGNMYNFPYLPVTDLFGVTFSSNVSMFVQRHVLVHENHFLFYHRNSISHYGEYSNTLLEGTNFGLKHSSISTHPGLSMDSSMMILSVQSDKHVQKTHSKVTNHCKRHCLNYQGEIHDKLTRMMSSMMSNIIALVDRYESIRVSETEWMVRKKDTSRSQQSKIAIPDFNVLQKVSVKNTSNISKQQLKCTCKYIEVYGMPCQHTITVARIFHPKWKGMTHYDVSVRWWKSYFLYSLPETVTTDHIRQQQIKQVLYVLRKHKSVGIHITEDMYTDTYIQSYPIPGKYVREGHVIKCTNYPDSNKVADFDPFHSNLDGTMS